MIQLLWTRDRANDEDDLRIEYQQEHNEDVEDGIYRCNRSNNDDRDWNDKRFVKWFAKRRDDEENNDIISKLDRIEIIYVKYKLFDHTVLSAFDAAVEKNIKQMKNSDHGNMFDLDDNLNEWIASYNCNMEEEENGCHVCTLEEGKKN